MNYEDPNYNVGLPVFMIHGNHDDPAGGENLSAIDLLATCNLVNYFGKHTLGGSGAGKIKLKPVLLQKGLTRVALYGLGYIRDARLHQMFSVKGNVEWARPEDAPGMRSSSWFNAMLIHQNRVHHTPKNAISERYLPSWLDLVVWGHEHECLVEPTEIGDFAVSQPGSSVVTSLVEGEARRKQILLLEVMADEENPDQAPFWRGTPIPLETVRPFKYEQVCLVDEARRPAEEGGLGPDWDGGETNERDGPRAAAGPGAGRRPPAAKHEGWVRALLERKVEAAIEEVLEPHVAIAARGGPEVPLPLVRLRVDYSGGFSTINSQRFGQKFVGKVANPNDLLQFHKSATRRRREEADAADAEAAANARMAAEAEDALGNPQLADQRRIEALVNQNLSKGLQMLSEDDLSNALDDFVNRDAGAISKLIEQRLKETQALVEEAHEFVDESDAEKRIGDAVHQRAAAAARETTRPDAGRGEVPEATPAETAAAERDRTRRAMEAGAERRATEQRGAGANGDAAAPNGARTNGAGRGAAAAPSGTLDAFLAPSQKSTRRGGGGDRSRPTATASGRAASTGRRAGSRAAAASAAAAAGGDPDDSGDAADSGDDGDSGDDEADVVPMSAPRRRGRAAGVAAKAAAATRATRATRGGHTRAKAPAKAKASEDDFEFRPSDDDDEDAEVVEDSEDSGDDADEIPATNPRRGTKRAAPGARGKASPAKKAKASPAKKAPPPGRARAARVVEIDDSGDEEEIPATARSTRGARRSTRAR